MKRTHFQSHWRLPSALPRNVLSLTEYRRRKVFLHLLPTLMSPSEALEMDAYSNFCREPTDILQNFKSTAASGWAKIKANASEFAENFGRERSRAIKDRIEDEARKTAKNLVANRTACRKGKTHRKNAVNQFPCGLVGLFRRMGDNRGTTEGAGSTEVPLTPYRCFTYLRALTFVLGATNKFHALE